MSMLPAVVCDVCDASSADWYQVGDRWICAGCWDPFGEFDHVSERRSRVRVDGVARGMLLPHLKRERPKGLELVTPTDSLGLITLDELVRSSDHD